MNTNSRNQNEALHALYKKQARIYRLYYATNQFRSTRNARVSVQANWTRFPRGQEDSRYPSPVKIE